MEDLFPLESSWVTAVAATVIALVMLVRLMRPLPFQNLLLIVVVLMLGEWLVEFYVIKVGRIFVPDPRWKYYLGAMWLWTAILLTARRIAKFIARPWRKEKVHWIWIIVLSAAGSMAFQFFWPLLDPEFTSRDRLLAMVGVRGLGTLVLLAVLSPWFIRKRPFHGKDSSELPDDPEDDAEQGAQQQASG